MQHNTKYKKFRQYITNSAQGGTHYLYIQHKIHFTSSEQQTQQHKQLHPNDNCRSYVWVYTENLLMAMFNLHTTITKFAEKQRKFDIHMSVHRNIITNYSQQDTTFLAFIYFYRRSVCFRRFLHPSSWVHNCTYSFRYCQPIPLLAVSSSIVWQYLKLYILLCAPDDGRRNHLKHAERL
jgi:hypothetical protein